MGEMNIHPPHSPFIRQGLQVMVVLVLGVRDRVCLSLRDRGRHTRQVSRGFSPIWDIDNFFWDIAPLKLGYWDIQEEFGILPTRPGGVLHAHLSLNYDIGILVIWL